MDFKCVSVLGTEELKELKKEVEKVLNARRGEEAQKLWDNIMSNFRALIRMDSQDTMITDNDSLYEIYEQFHCKPEWEFDKEED